MRDFYPKNLFLIDSAGALLTALILGLILPWHKDLFGMPRNVLYFLSSIAFIFFAYSFLCYLLIKHSWKPYLRFIAVANLVYCCITLGIVIFLRTELTIFGWIYFFLEAIVIISLAIFELRSSYT